MVQYKIIFTGPAGAGKTTAIGSISDIPPTKTDVAIRDTAKPGKLAATVAMDYGWMTLEGGEKIHLYGTSGQQRSDFIWETLVSDGIGLILLLDNTRKDVFRDMKFFLEDFSDFINKTSVAIGVTRMDLCASHSMEEYYTFLQGWALKPPVFTVDARSKNDVSLLVQSLLYTIDPGARGE